MKNRTGLTALRLGVSGLVAAALCMACGSDTTTGGGGGAGGQGGTTSSGTGGGGTGGGGTGGGSQGGGGQGGAGQASTECLALCGQSELSCWGPDTENGTVTFSDVTATGCTATVVLASSGTFTFTLDCVAEETCMTAGNAGCLGTPGECEPTTFTTSSFSYHIPECVNGSLSCSDN